MTVIKPNSIAGVTSITAQGDTINFYKSDGTLAGLLLNGVNFNTTSGVSTFNNVTVGGTITYQDVAHVDSVGIITAQQGIQVLANGLDVTGVSTFSSDISIADKIIHTGDTNTAIRFPAADTFTVETAGTERLRVSSNVGVGDNNPSVKFNVKGSGDSLAGLNVHSKIEDTTSLAADVGGMLAFEGVYTSGGNEAVYSAIHGGKENATNGNYQGYFRILTRPDGGLPVERLRITSSGNVGIGTDNPSQQKLTIDVKNSGTAQASFNGINIANTDSTTNNGAAIIFGQTIAGNSFARIGVINSDRTGSSEDQDIFFGTLGGGSYGERLRITSTGDFVVGGGATFGASVGVVTYYGDGSQLSGISVGLTTESASPNNTITHLDLTNAQDHKLIVSGITTISVTGGSEADSHTIRIQNSGISTVGFSTYFLFPSGAAPTLPTADGAISLISFTVHRVGAAGTQLLAGASVNFS